VEEGLECEFVCKEFKFGGTSNLFIGNLKQYINYLDEIQEILTEFGTEDHSNPLE